ncbi:MAG: hypothetical protein AAFV45_08495, partial [Pseudomonadota bacterium]
AAPPDVGQEARKQEGPARGAFLLEMPTLTVAYSYSGALAYILSGVDMNVWFLARITAIGPLRRFIAAQRHFRF